MIFYFFFCFLSGFFFFFFFQAEDGIRDKLVTGVQTCALPIWPSVPTLALLGGDLSKEKLLLAQEIARRSDHTLVAGRLSLPFLVARGVLPDDAALSAAVSDEMIAIAERMMRQAQ